MSPSRSRRVRLCGRRHLSDAGDGLGRDGQTLAWAGQVAPGLQADKRAEPLGTAKREQETVEVQHATQA